MTSTAAFRIKRQKGGNTDLSSVLLSPPPLPQPCPIYQCLHTQGGMKTDHALSRPQMRFPFIWHCVALEVCFEGKQSFNGGLVCVVSVWKHSAKESPWRGLAALLSLNNEFSLTHQIHTWQFWGRSLSLLLMFFKKKISHLKNKTTLDLSSLSILVNASAIQGQMLHATPGIKVDPLQLPASWLHAVQLHVSLS